MPKTIIAEGKTSTEAIEKGLKELKATRSQVDVKILEEKKKSFFSILDPHVVKVELTIREDSIPEKKEKNIEKKEINRNRMGQAEKKDKAVENFLNNFLNKISSNIEYTVKNENGLVYVNIKGEDSTRLIGYRGEALNALQTLLTTVASKNREESVKVILVIGNYSVGEGDRRRVVIAKK